MSNLPLRRRLCDAGVEETHRRFWEEEADVAGHSEPERSIDRGRLIAWRRRALSETHGGDTQRLRYSRKQLAVSSKRMPSMDEKEDAIRLCQSI